MCDLCHDRCRPCSESAAHRRRNNDKIRSIQHLSDGSFLIARRLLTDLDAAACAASLCQSLPDRQHRNPLLAQCVELTQIRIDADEHHVKIIVLAHIGQDVAPAAAHTNDLDRNFGFDDSLGRHITPPY